MFRTLMSITVAMMLAGCINTPNTKVVITPVGGIGFHTFAPHKDPDRLPPPDADSIPRIAANQRACAQDAACARHQ
jgi:hypothetical protein